MCGPRTPVIRPGATRRADHRPRAALALGMVDEPTEPTEPTEPGELLPPAVALAAALAARSPGRPVAGVPTGWPRSHSTAPANAAIEGTVSGDVAVLAGWASDDTRLHVEAALAALARR